MTAEGGSWWAYERHIPCSAFSRYLDMESQAISFNQVSSRILPGLLQTPEYALGILREYYSSLEQTEALLELRMARQATLRNRDPILQQTFLINRAALQRQVGNREVMHAQLESLTERSDVTIALLPSSQDSDQEAGFLVLETSEKTVVYLEHGLECTLTAGHDTTPFVQRFTTLSNLSMEPAESIRQINELNRQLWEAR